MTTMLVGFRLGSDTRGRQVTVLLSGSGVLYRAAGAYGEPPVLARPEVARGARGSGALPAHGPAGHPVGALTGRLRAAHAEYTAEGFGRALIPPATVEVDVDEGPLTGPDRGPLPHRALLEGFVGLAPGTGGGSAADLDRAIRAFRGALGLPAVEEPRGARAPRPPVSPAVRELIVRLARSRAITPGAARPPVPWTVTREAVRFHPHARDAGLDRASALELHAALTAWLHATAPPAPPH
ncbi:hypothetical protein ACN20G_30445 (plasmid) [Streptomyces sp. BI20]|uniref:hypothetical protein n=1 Tax=Streptomyces sp. BI20 TaxID=3403460 RepID=UPI003C707D75